ncbi:MAG TPA: ATP-binding protein [Candidatus Limnocylindrales bacterium]|nr:ATP-binding protein [Candidatus Limnocylindrales bacterium]
MEKNKHTAEKGSYLPNVESSTLEGSFSLTEKIASCRLILEDSPLAIIIVQGETHRVSYVNLAFCRLSGKNKEDLVGRPLAEAFPESLSRDSLTLLDQVYHTGEAAFLINRAHIHPQRGTIYWTYTVWPIRNAQGDPEGLIIQINDTTEQVLAHEHAEQITSEIREINERLLITSVREQTARTELELAQKRLTFLTEASTQLVTSLDYENSLEKLAHLPVPYLCDFCLIDIITEDQVLHRSAIAHVNPSKLPLLQELQKSYVPHLGKEHPIVNVLRTGRSEIYPEITDELLATKYALDAKHLSILQKLEIKSSMHIPLRARGRTLGVITFVSADSGRHYDLTDLALAEDFTQRAAIIIDNARLLHEVQEVNRRKDEFLAMLAHELRNPLAPILNSLEIIRLRQIDDPILKRSLDILERQAQYIVRLLDDLSDVSRITQGKIQLNKEPLDLATIVVGAVETSRPLIEARKHELLISLPKEPLKLEADPVRLRQILINLLNNAAKYTPPGGRIWLMGTREENEVVIRIRDTGMGIPPEMLSRIFDLFIQVDQSLDRTQGGLGIGLTLVRSLVEMHGGKVSAHSPGPGQGSEFVIRLPALHHPESQTQNLEPVNSESETIRSKRILVVDDNMDASKSLGELLELWGYEVQIVHDGLMALQVGLAYQPEIVILDIGLPGKDGYEVARQLRQQINLPDLVLIALTGYGQEEDKRQSREAGFDYHFTKPVDLAALHKLLTGLSKPKS